jgi:hypothetical protein
MTNEDREMIAVTASMEGNATVCANIGRKVTVSEMELICLVNFAAAGLWFLYSQLEDELGEYAERELEKTFETIRRVFASKGQDGLERLSCSLAAILNSERFIKYRVELPR